MNLPLLLTQIDKLSQVVRSRDLLRALVRHRVLVGAEHRQVFRPKLATVVDIGANRGQFSLAVRGNGRGRNEKTEAQGPGVGRGD